MIKYKGHTISQDFRGHDKPPGHTVRRLSASGTYATEMFGSYETEDAAKAVIDRRCPMCESLCDHAAWDGVHCPWCPKPKDVA